jgi:hypothetical protein
MKYLVGLLMLVSSAVYAHEMTPTYPKFNTSYIDGVASTTLELFNKRADVEYYEIGVFNADWKSVDFVTKYQVVRVPYLNKVILEIFVRKSDLDQVVYICSQSKLRKQDITRTAISSKICSKIKIE